MTEKSRLNQGDYIKKRGNVFPLVAFGVAKTIKGHLVSVDLLSVLKIVDV